MSYEITGRLLVKYDTQIVSDRFQKREFVLHIEENNNGTIYESTPKFQMTQDRCDLLEVFNEGEEIKVTFNVKGNKWEKDGVTSYFSNLDAWKIEKLSTSVAAPVEEVKFDTTGTRITDEEDELPF